MTSTLRRLRAGSAIFLILAFCALVLAMSDLGPLPPAATLAAAATLFTVFAGVHVLSWLLGWLDRRKLGVVLEFLEYDSAPGLCTDRQGLIFAQNTAARERLGNRAGETMTRALEPIFASPDAVVHRLKLAVDRQSATREDVVTRRGHVRVAVHRIPGGLLWRLEDLADRPRRGADGIGLPMLTFGASGTIIFMNETLRDLVGERVRRLGDLFDTLPLENGALNEIRTRDGAQSVRLMISPEVGGRQEAFILPAGPEGDGRVALDALPVALLRLDKSGHVVAANRAARELLPPSGRDGERRLAAMVEGLGRSISEWVTEAAAGRGLNRSEMVRVTGAEPETFLQITLGRPVGDGSGGLIAVLNDATELKTMEAQFVQSQKMQAIGQLAGGIAHDFNNLLTAISGHCDLLLLRHGEGDEDHADLTQIIQNANRAAALVGQLLAFSRKQTLKMNDIDLRDTLGDLTHLLNRLVGERIALNLQHDPALIPIRGDRRQLEQVLMNLVVNARDAMPDGGEIRIETRCRFLDAPLRRDRVTMPAGQYVVITVSDDGCGIPDDALGRIFEPFFTTKRPGEGTGLGLSMAYGIVKQSGGYIFADSEPGEGTTFSLYFPAIGEIGAGAAPAEAASHAMPSPEALMPAARPRAVGDGRPALAAERPIGAPAVPEVVPASEAEPAPLAAEADIIPAASEAPLQLPIAQLVEDEAAPSPGEAGEDPDHSKGALERDIADLVSSTAKETEGEDEMPVRAGEAPENQEKDEAADEEGPDAGATAGQLAPRPFPPAKKGAMSRAQARDPRVLLVEDEAPVRAFASRALRLKGYEVLEAASAEDALRTLEDDALEIDLFVTDVMMPGLDGPTWVRRALRARPHVHTIFVSGYTQDALSETSAPVPNATFLAKPFSLSDLTRTVERALA